MKRVALAFGGIALAVALLVLLVGPALIDTPAVRAEIQGRLSQALQGQVTWESLELALLPAPHGELRQVRIEMPGKLSAAAEDLDVHLRLWPLLRGRAEISSFTLRKPSIRIVAASGGESATSDVLAAYRAVVEPVARALQELAPETTVRIEGATIEPAGLRDLDVDAHTGVSGLNLKLSATSARWKRLSLDGRLEYADLSARVKVEVDGLRAELRTDARTAIDAEVSDVALAPVFAIARREAPGLAAIESLEGKVSAKASIRSGTPWRVDIALSRSDAAVKLAALPFPVAVRAAQVTLTQGQVRVAHAHGAVGDSTFQDAAAQIDFGASPHLSAATGRATLKLEQWFPWLRAQVPLEPITALSGSVDVTLNRLALRFDRPAAAHYEALVVPREVSVGLHYLPTPIVMTSGSARIDPTGVRLDGMTVATMDARVLASGSVLTKGPKVELALAEGALGAQAVRWALERGAVAERFEPKTPLRFSARRIAWSPGRPLEADARLEFDDGPTLGVVLAWRPGLLELRRLTIKDARSDAVLGASVAGELIKASFSGTLHGHSIPAMLRRPLPEASGIAQGELRVTIDRKRPERTAAEGKLSVAALDLSWLAGKKALIERADFIGEGTGGRITGARFGWDEQFFELRGEARRGAAGPEIDARIESAGVDVGRLLPPPDPNAPRRKSATLWPLPVSGRVEVSSGFVQYKDYRIAPFDGILSLEPSRARFEVKAARMCGVSFPMELEAQPKNNRAAAHIRMQNEPLEKTLPCLTGGSVEITGNADLSAELRAQGRRPHLLRDMTGTAQAELRNGQVRKLALLGNILSFRGIASPERLRDDGFPYRSITARGRFQNGQFLVEESFFDSDAVRLAAHGRVDMLGADSQLTVLVGVLTNVDRLAGAIPIIGDIFGGSMTALPMAVRGDIRDPTIVPLGPRAVTEQLLGIFERTLKLPGKLVPADGAKKP